MMAMMIGVVCRQCNPTNKVLIVPTRNTTKWYVRRGTNICYAREKKFQSSLALAFRRWVGSERFRHRDANDLMILWTPHTCEPQPMWEMIGRKGAECCDWQTYVAVPTCTVPYGIQCITVPLVFIMHGNLVWAKLLCYATKIHSTL